MQLFVAGDERGHERPRHTHPAIHSKRQDSVGLSTTQREAIQAEKWGIGLLCPGLQPAGMAPCCADCLICGDKLSGRYLKHNKAPNYFRK
eukprot:scaffold274483_cov34-Prasinocladus_malaysianus.AAC.2